jgi:carbon-monoxide dehydrogenase medium subunit
VFPTAFDYLRAHSVDEALAALTQHGAEARVLAGGQSLIPAMRYRLARPAMLIDVNPITTLAYLQEEDGWLRVGALTRDATLEHAAFLDRYPLLADCSGVVADPVVRHMGTLVGSLCHNDPAGDWAATALAARAMVVIQGGNGRRDVPIDAFLVDSYTTAVGEDEMAVEVRFPIPSPRTAGAYEKIERKVGDYATAAAAVQITLDAQGICTGAGVALAALGPTALRVAAAEHVLVGQRPSEELFRAAAEEAPRVADPATDGRGSAAYKKEMGRVLVLRGLRRALQRIEAVA